MGCTRHAVRGVICPLCCGLLGLAAMPAAGPAERTFYVSPAGDDRSEGTEARPFATLHRARQAVREVNRAMTGDIEVVLRGGT